MDGDSTRRGFLRTVCGGVVGAAGPATAAEASADGENAPSRQAAGAGDHPTLAVDAANTGHNPEATAPPGDPVERWTLEADAVVGSPVVANGVVYAATNGGGLLAVAADTGRLRWRFETGTEYLAAPTVVDGTVYATSTAGHIYAVDAEAGTERWRFDAGEFYSTPTVVDGVVYAGSVDTNVYAVDADDGTERWRFGTPSRVGRIETAPAVADGVVYVGIDNNPARVYALDADDGTERWRFEGPDNGPFVAAPALVGETLYAGSEYDALYALDVDDGSERWRFRFEPDDPIGMAASPAVADGVVYAADNGGSVRALDAETGTERWRTDLCGAVFAAPLVVGGTLFVCCDALYALDVGDGSERWRFELPGGPLRAPAVADGTLYVGSSDEALYALAEAGSADATPTGTPTADGTPTAPPAAGVDDADGPGTGWWLPATAGGTALAAGALAAAWYRRRRGSAGTLRVHNARDGPAVCRVGCRVDGDSRFAREYRLAAGETVEAGDLPREGSFELAVQLEDGPDATRAVDDGGGVDFVCRIAEDGVAIAPAD